MSTTNERWEKIKNRILWPLASVMVIAFCWWLQGIAITVAQSFIKDTMNAETRGFIERIERNQNSLNTLNMQAANQKNEIKSIQEQTREISEIRSDIKSILRILAERNSN